MRAIAVHQLASPARAVSGFTVDGPAGLDGRVAAEKPCSASARAACRRSCRLSSSETRSPAARSARAAARAGAEVAGRVHEEGDAPGRCRRLGAPRAIPPARSRMVTSRSKPMENPQAGHLPAEQSADHAGRSARPPRSTRERRATSPRRSCPCSSPCRAPAWDRTAPGPPPASRGSTVRMIQASDSKAGPAPAAPAAEQRGQRLQRQLALLQGGQQALEPLDGGGGVAGLAQLAEHALRADLVQLVEGDEEAALGGLGEAAVPGDRAEEPPVVDAHGEVAQAQPGRAPRRWRG